MGIFEDYARKKDAERQEIRQSASDYFLDNEGTGLTDAAARAVGDAVSGVPGMFDAVGNFVGETYDTGGTNISDAAMALYNNPELRNKLSINSMVRDTTEAMGRAYENEYPNTVAGSDERYADYLASLGVFSGGALAGTKVLGDVVGAVNKGTPGNLEDILQNESRREFGQNAAAAAVTAAVAPSLLGNFAKKAAVGTAAAGAATSLGASVAKLKSLSDKFEKAFDDIAGDDPGDGNFADDSIDYHLNMYNAELMEERKAAFSEIIEDFGANNGANLPNLSNDDLMSLDGQMRYMDYDYLGDRVRDSDMDMEGEPTMVDPSSNPQLAELRALIAKEKERRGIKGVNIGSLPRLKVDDTSDLLKDLLGPSMKMTGDGQGELDLTPSIAEELKALNNRAALGERSELEERLRSDGENPVDIRRRLELFDRQKGLNQSTVVNREEAGYPPSKITDYNHKPEAPFAVRQTGESQVQDMIQSGVVRVPNVPGGSRGKKKSWARNPSQSLENFWPPGVDESGAPTGKPFNRSVYFGNSAEAGASKYATPGDSNKNITIIADGKVLESYSGQSETIPIDALQHVWHTRKNGTVVDILPDILEANKTGNPIKFAGGGLATLSRRR